MTRQEAKPVVVVVNDDPTQANILIELLAQAGVVVRAFESAAAALAAMNPAAPPEWLVTDLYTPGMLRAQDLLEARTRELRASEAYYRALFESVSDAVLVHEIGLDGLPGKFIAANRVALERLGYTREDLLKLTPRDIAADDAFQDLAEVRANIASAGTAMFETVHLSRDGQRIPVESHVSVLELGGRRVAISVVRDLSERKQMELALQRRDALLDAALRASGLLLAAETPAKVLGELVRLLGEASGQDRAYYFAWHTHCTTGKIKISLCQEWVREGIAPQQDNPLLQELPFDEVASYSCERLRQGLEVCALVRDLPSREREVLEPQRIVSLFLMPIMVNGVPEGFIGFDNCRTEYAWTAGERAALAVVAANLGAALVRSRAEAALRESEVRFRELVDQLPEVVFELDANFRLTFANRRAFGLFGYTPGELASGLDPLDMLVPEDRPRARETLARRLQQQDLGAREYTGLRKDGTTFPLLLHNRAVFRQGVLVGTRGIIIDITERKRTEQELRRSEEAAARQRSAIAGLVLDKVFAGGETSPALQRVVEVLSATLDVARASVWTLVEGGATLRCLSLYEAGKKTPSGGATLRAVDFPRYFDALRSEHRIYAEDAPNDPRTAEMTTSYLKPLGIASMLDAGVFLEGKLVGVVCSEHIGARRKWHSDEESFVATIAAIVAQLLLNAERKHAEEEREHALAVLQSALAQSPAGILIADAPDVSIRWANAAAVGIRGETSLPLTGIEVGRHASHWQTFRTDGRPYPSEELPLSRAVLKGEVARSEEVIIRHASGEDRWVSVNAAPIRGPDGAITAGIVVFSDITPLKQAEAALKASEAKFRQLVENTNDIIYSLTPEGFFTFVSPAWTRLLGHAVAEVEGHSFTEFVHPDDLPSCYAFMEKVVETGARQEGVEYRVRHQNGEWKWHTTSASPFRDATGALAGADCLARDITDRKRAEAEREQLRAQFVQAQKMESMGRLAGGVAHDFNNMLQAILGYADLALQDLPPDSPLQENLSEIQSCAQRSADLTRQLLAFARKQTIAPKVLDLNTTIEGMLNMLRRLIGEDMELAWKPGHDLWPVRLDPSQADQILANLCLNARDAITGVGVITIATDNAVFDEDYCAQRAAYTPGDYVRLAVSDNGCGMDAETLSHLFEPFFTTKATGKGTGLGLATVYGTVKQNNGFVNVCSEPGQGTTFNIYLPRHGTKAARMAGEHQPQAPGSGRETILLVEDEPTILNLLRRMLEGLGYVVLAACTPGEAIRLAREHAGQIDLLFTDVVMPEMNGRDLARNILTLHPHIKRLFSSGYTADVIAHQGVLDPGVHLIQKPFSPQALGAKVREVLEH